MKRALASLLALALSIAPLHAQDLINPQTNASRLTTGTLPAARLPSIYGNFTKAAAQAYTATAAAQVTLDTATNNQGLTFGSNQVTIITAGAYQISACWTSNTTLTSGQAARSYIYKNGSPIFIATAPASGFSGQTTPCARTVAVLAASDVIAMFISAEANTSTVAAGTQGVELTLSFVGP
jgi:hypothetical protein